MSIINNQQRNKIALTPDLDFAKIVEDKKPELEKGLEELLDQEGGELFFYCKECKKNIDIAQTVRKSKKKNEYICPVCGDNRIVRGTQKSLSGYFKN